MGLEISKDAFDEPEFEAFSRKLEVDLAALRVLLARPGFGRGPTTIGAELELNLVDDAGRPALVNQELLDHLADPRLSPEINRYNIELNARPAPLAGASLAAMATELREGLAAVRAGARHLGARVVPIGILPTLRQADLGQAVMTDGHRYRALSAGFRRLRQQPFLIDIQGEEALRVRAEDVTFEGANTSLQAHLRVDPAAFADTFNAAQLATGVVLSCAANSPFFLGRRLWHETRVALFRQAVDDRANVGPEDWRPARVSFGHGWVRQGALELFAESVALYAPLLPVVGSEDPAGVVRAGGVPELRELRLHHGTIWPWNRAVFDDADGGHLRIEMRALPAGPTAADMTANAAFLLGLTLALAPRMRELSARITFGHARRNFYEAARLGLDAELLWPADSGSSPQPERAAALVPRLLPLAESGLRAGGVDAADVDRFLGIIAARTASGRTGACWQREQVALRSPRLPIDRALAEMLRGYLERTESELPVHTWA